MSTESTLPDEVRCDSSVKVFRVLPVNNNDPEAALVHWERKPHQDDVTTGPDKIFVGDWVDMTAITRARYEVRMASEAVERERLRAFNKRGKVEVAIDNAVSTKTTLDYNYLGAPIIPKHFNKAQRG